jgi:rhamnosyltransferase
VPTRNGAATLPQLLDAIASQRVDLAYEVVAVDSGSTDGTVDLLRSRGHRVISIPPHTFDHGLSRNEGVRHSRGELIVLMVQDAVPASDRLLAALTAPFRHDERLAGTFARQHARPESSALTRLYLSRYPGASPEPRSASLAGLGELERLTPAERLARCTFDNVCACLRRSVWEAHPFRTTPIAEDVEWARDVLLAGYTLRYVPEAEVFHSHERSPAYEFQRTYILHYRLYELFALRTIPSLPLLIRAVASCVPVHWRCQRGLRSLALAVAWPLGQYLGALTAANGWKPLRAGAV